MRGERKIRNCTAEEDEEEGQKKSTKMDLLCNSEEGEKGRSREREKENEASL